MLVIGVSVPPLSLLDFVVASNDFSLNALAVVPAGLLDDVGLDNLDTKGMLFLTWESSFDSIAVF